MGLTETVVCPHCEEELGYHETDWHAKDADEAADPTCNGIVACQKCHTVLGVRDF
jgi:uncharacterized protein YbaR (Trm112 family)